MDLSSKPNSQRSTFIESIHLLRGLAAILVVIDHSIGWIDLPLLAPLFWVIDGHGELGVSVFFVLSGFVLPFSLGPKYSLRSYPNFLSRRLIRIEPTFLVSLLVAGSILYFKTRLSQSGDPWTPDLGQIAAHLLYLIPFTSYSWMNEVYWTLAIEFQYYLIIGLCFPVANLIGGKVRFGNDLFVLIFALFVFGVSMFPKVGILQQAPLFALGISSYYLFLNQANCMQALLRCGVISGIGVLGGLEWQTVLGGSATVFLIVFWKAPRIKFRWLGTISYSLYIIHYPIVTFINQAAIRFFTGKMAWLNYLVPVLCVLASLVAAWLLYRFVEAPTQRFSKKLRQNRFRCQDYRT